MFRFVLNVISEGVSSRDDNVSFFFQKREKGDIAICGNDLPGSSIFLLILQRKLTIRLLHFDGLQRKGI